MVPRSCPTTKWNNDQGQMLTNLFIYFCWVKAQDLRCRVGSTCKTLLVYYLGWNRSSAQVGCMRQVLGAGALGRPRGIGCRGRWEGELRWGIHVNPWLIHVNVWQKPLQYCKVLSLQLIKKNKQTLLGNLVAPFFLWLKWSSWQLCTSYAFETWVFSAPVLRENQPSAELNGNTK